MSVVYLPPTIALKSNWFNLYLNYSDDSYSSTQGFVKFNGSNVFSPLAKFEVVSANTGTGRVHLRCRANKKFLRRKDSTSVFITPEADEAEEDTAKWGCTLFEAREVEAGNTTLINLFHVQSQYYTNAWDVSGIRSLRLNSVGPNFQGRYNILDLESMVILPKYVAFKGTNGKYLKVGATATSYPTFSSTDKGFSECGFEVITDGHGRAQIMSSHTKKYLRLVKGGNFIMADSTGDTTDLDTKFWPVKFNNGAVALKSLGIDLFCCQYTLPTWGVTDGLRALHASINIDAVLTLEELVHERRIYNTNFDLKNAIIYGETPLTMATANAINNTSKDNTVEFKFTYTESKSTTWTSSHSWMVGISVTASFKVPFIGGGEVTANAEYSGSYEWGETLESEQTVEKTYTATVPANSSINLTAIATQGTCDVRYSYYQRDLLYNGQTVIYQKDDGLCTGINSYNFHIEVTTVKDLGSTAESRTVQKIPLPLLSGPTTPLTSTTSTEQELSEVQFEEWIVQEVPALPLKTNEEGVETIA
ncbi:PREDICTED: uncharacterized protein LOC101290690 [Fragaria vesca subsp. vesca]|uniref:uncharacterized protein LOC101290690 n=1 Tax=Fragaria vesca subsp. vesca TaxID=101020 RepID=UPI0002C30711|nr:PREDICTED: uncharacterized protein LOC101290690 [Fragaria vesca subsp. vesca]